MREGSRRMALVKVKKNHQILHLIRVNPGKPDPLTWQQKVNTEEINLSLFSLNWKQIIQMAPIGIRIWHYIQEESAKGQIFINPFVKRWFTSSHGIPLGGTSGRT